MNTGPTPFLRDSPRTVSSSNSSSQDPPELEVQGDFNGTTVEETESEKHLTAINPNLTSVNQNNSPQRLSSDSIQLMTDSNAPSSPASVPHTSSYHSPSTPEQLNLYKTKQDIRNKMMSMKSKAQDAEDENDQETATLYYFINDCFQEILSSLKEETPPKDKEATLALFTSAIMYAKVAIEEIKSPEQEKEVVKHIASSAKCLLKAGIATAAGKHTIADAFHNLAGSFYFLAAAMNPALGKHLPKNLNIFQEITTPNEGLIKYWKNAVILNRTQLTSLLEANS
ncbi:MAG: hypothetical protein ACOYK6_07610 [Chthoniobacterales bacterium]